MREFTRNKNLLKADDKYGVNDSLLELNTNWDIIDDEFGRLDSDLADIAVTNVNVEVSNAHRGSDGNTYTDLPSRLDSIDTDISVVESNLAQIMSNAIYASAYGVKADGVTDDTSAFQSAINASNTLNKPLFITGTRIRITQPILINDGVKINLRGVSSGFGGLVSIWLDMPAGSNGVLFQGVPTSGNTRANSGGEISGIQFQVYTTPYGTSVHTFMKDIAYQGSLIQKCSIGGFKYVFSNVSLGSVTNLKDNNIVQVGKAVFTNNCNLGDFRMFGNYFNGNATYKPIGTYAQYPDFIDSSSPIQVFTLCQINNNWFEFFTNCLGQLAESEVTGNIFDYCYNVLNASDTVVFTGNFINHATASQIISNIQSFGNTASSVYTTPSSILKLGVYGSVVSGNHVYADLITSNNTYFVKLMGGAGGQTGMVYNTSVIGNTFNTCTRDMIIDFSSIDFTNTTSYFNTQQLVNCDFRDLDQIPLTSVPQPTDKLFIPNSTITVNNEKMLGVKFDSGNLQGGATPYHLVDMRGDLRNFKTQNLVNKFSGSGWSLANDTPSVSSDGLSVSFNPSTTGWKNSTFTINGVTPNTYYRICANSPESNSNGILLELWLYDSSNTKIGTWYCSTLTEVIGLTPSNIDHIVVYLRKNLTTVAPYSIGMVSINKFSTTPTRQIIMGSKYRFGQYFDGTTMQYEPFI